MSDFTYSPEVHHTELGDNFYDVVTPANFLETTIRFRNDRIAKTVGLSHFTDDEWCNHFGRFAPLADNLPEPLALRYHGHQFQTYNPQIGDGRGFLFAQLRDQKGRLLDFGTKGSGQTPWSRTADGRLTLKGGVREILATEMLEALGVNTSKTFSLIETGEQLHRGDEPSPTRSSVLVRLNHSHIRIGTFQRLLYQDQKYDIRKLVDYCIQYYWPEAANHEDPIIGFYELAMEAIAKMTAQWFAAGFVHGVLNTDNITITGESFDYGPWRFAPILDPNFTAAYFDQNGLYAFGRQPDAIYWNLARFAECLIPISDRAKLEISLKKYPAIFDIELKKQTLMRLGLKPEPNEKDNAFVHTLYSAMQTTGVPFEQVFFDLIGGADQARISQSRISEIYEKDPFASLISEIRTRETVDNAKQILQADILRQDSRPVTMLVDEVEEIWSHIDAHDDWSHLTQKIAQIHQMSDVTRLLQAASPLTD